MAQHPLTDLPPSLWKMVSWLEEICPYQYVEKYVQYSQTKDNKTHRFKIFTKENQYNIVVNMNDDDVPHYIGASFISRKPRAGEDWNRGNDLPDGDYSEEKLGYIKSAIVATELVKIISPKHPGETSIISYGKNKKHFKEDSESLNMLPPWHSYNLKKRYEEQDTKCIDKY